MKRISYARCFRLARPGYDPNLSQPFTFVHYGGGGALFSTDAKPRSPRNDAAVFDFRSDTVTKPTEAMVDFMKSRLHQIGDDVYEEDEVTRELEASMATLTGHEAALFCASGTMTNQLAIRSWIRGPLESVLLDSRSHIYRYENQGIAYHTGAGTIPVSPEGSAKYLTVDQIQRHIVEPDIHCADTKLICLENTLNGNIMPIHEIQKIATFAKAKGLGLHLDGARLWNAVVATGVDLKEWCRHFDSVSLCLSKGIGAPVGSILVGPKSFIRTARHYRKLLGGGWRQSGLLAAAALYALHHSTPSICINGYDTSIPSHTPDVLSNPTPSPAWHRNIQYAHSLTQWLSQQLIQHGQPLVQVMNPQPDTNMLFLNVQPRRVHEFHHLFQQHLPPNGPTVILPEWGYASQNDTMMRLVLHHQVTPDACQLLVNTVRSMVINGQSG